MARPLISVVMSVYNARKYLSKALESILNQTLEAFEFIIINDGSTDGSIDILNQYKRNDRRIRLLHQENKGLVASLNRGCKSAKGKYIARMDADDVSITTRFEKQLAYLEENPDVGIVGTQMNLVNETGVATGEYDLPLSHNMIAWMIPFGRSFAHATIMIKRSLLQDVGFYNVQYRHAEDIDLWTRLAGQTMFANLDERLYLYRSLPGSICHVHRQEQLKNVYIAIRQYVSELIQRDIRTEHAGWLRDSLDSYASITKQEAGETVSLIYDIYRALLYKGVLDKSDVEEIKRDVRSRVKNILGRRFALGPEYENRGFMYSLIPGLYQKAVAAINNPADVIPALIRKVRFFTSDGKSSGRGSSRSI